MGWGKGESIIELRREQIGADPRGTIQALREDLRQEDLKPRERVRLLCLVVACHRELGERSQVEAALAEARAVPKSGRIASLEILSQETEALLQWAYEGKETWEKALACSVVFLQETEELPRKHPRTAWGRRQERSRCGVRVHALVARGQVGLFTGDLDTAMKYGFRALREAPPFPKAGPIPSYALRLYRCGISLVATTLVRGGKGDLLDFAVASVQELIQSLPSTENLVRSCLSALLGCVAVRKGRFDEAVKVFEEALDTLSSIGADSAYRIVLSMWEWSVQHVEDQATRVQEYVARRRVKLPPLG